MPARKWKAALAQFAILFPERDVSNDPKHR